jgi:DNA polymerase-3 subunit delta
MTYQEIVAEFKKKIYRPVYFLCGEESYFIDKISRHLEQSVVDESSRDFNLTIMYGRDVDTRQIINAAKRFPMMSDKQLVVVKEAQNIKKLDELVSYIDNPLSSTVLVISFKHKSLDKRTALYKKIKASKNVAFMESKKLYDNQVPDWITKYCSHKKFNIDTKAAMLMVEFLGNDLSKVSNELDKLMISCENTRVITSDNIAENIGVSKDFNNFELINAIGKKDVLKVNRIINYFEANQKNHPIFVTISALFGYFTALLSYSFIPEKNNKQALARGMGINPYFVKDYVAATRLYSPKKVVDSIALLREFDLKAKGVNNAGTPPGELLREMVYKIMH